MPKNGNCLIFFDRHVHHSEEILVANREGRPRGAIYLKNLRLRKNISQEELSKKTRISKTNISAYENGKRKITEKIAQRLAKVLNSQAYKKLLKV